MSTETDLLRQDEARDLSRRALAWIRSHPSIAVLEEGGDPVVLVDPGEDFVFYASAPDGSRIGFGQLLSRPGTPRYGEAALGSFLSDGIRHLAICASDTWPAGRDEPVGQATSASHLFHEAVHALDFRSRPRLPQGFRREHLGRLGERYWNTPHEREAFFHQGLRAFLDDETDVRRRIGRQARPGDRTSWWRETVRIATAGRHWHPGFLAGLTERNRRRFLRRLMRLLAVRMPPRWDAVVQPLADVSDTVS